MNRPGPVQPVGCRSVMTTGIGVALVAAGAILRFALPAAFINGLDLRVAGVIVMLAGVIALLLSLLVWGPLSRRGNHSGGYGSGTPPIARQRSVPGPDAGAKAVAAVTGSPRHPRPAPRRIDPAVQLGRRR